MGLIFYLKNRNLAYWVLITVFGIICLVQDFGIDSSTHHNRCDSIRAPTTVDDFTFDLPQRVHRLRDVPLGGQIGLCALSAAFRL